MQGNIKISFLELDPLAILHFQRGGTMANSSNMPKRVRDGSIFYDQFDVSDGKIEYNISKCMYVEMFSYYGIRSLCKIFCITDEYAYSRLTKRVKFIRHSDLSEGECCHDEIIRK